MLQRQSPRGTHQVRSSSSDSDPSHHRPITDRSSPKVGDRRSPRGAPQSDPLNQKKLGTRIADLESQLGQAQDELKILKNQLASAEAAKKEAQQELENKSKKPKAPEPVEPNEKISPKRTRDSKKSDCSIRDEVPGDNQKETDVFEVPVEKAAIEPKVEVEEVEQAEEKTKAIEKSTAPTEFEPEKPSLQDLALKNDEINMLKSKLEEKEKELSLFAEENENLKKQLNEATSNFSSAKSKEKEISLKLGQVGEELEASKTNAAQLKEKLQSVEEQKEALEAEMKKLRVQTEQWRKAADAAAAILSGGMEMNGRISNRCSSMDKHFGGVFETPAGGGFAGYVGSPGLGDDMDDGFGSGKRKGSGIKMFGDLWKKKSQK
ncbi:hypothetical protein V6N13_085395 [Hibiscus sabdariffa]|uniref:Interactor of constitutive active ROPs 4 n=1 Tax=Hibiscus sabdariffa TaxID=183260 RepID=A0ABR2D1G1_9ROSI